VEDVLPIDFAHYNITCESYQLPEPPNATYRTDAVTFMLNSSDSMLVMNCMFRNGVQYTCDLGVQQGSPAYVRDCSNLLEVARAIIAEHQAQTGVDCSYLLKTLNLVTSTENMTTVIFGNVKLTASSRALPMGLLTANGVNGTLHIHPDPSNTRNVTSLRWTCIGDSEEQTIFALDFDNGNLDAFFDGIIIGDFPVSQANDDGEAGNVTVESPISYGTKSEGNQEQPAFQSQSESTSFPFMLLVAVSFLGATTACMGAVFHHKRHLKPRKAASIPLTQDEAESF
jgi:hypothetical protein